MKKEKKRELTVEQLEKREDIATKIVGYISIGTICIVIVTILILCIISIVTGITFSFADIFRRFVTIGLGILFILIIAGYFSDKYQLKIRMKKKKDKVYEIKQMSGHEDIKEKVVLKDKMLRNAILSNNIDRVVFREIKVGAIIPKTADCTIELYLKDGSCMQSFFSMEDFLELINRASKDSMLNHLIKSIKIEDSKVEINAENFSHKEKITDDELIEMFELKE